MQSIILIGENYALSTRYVDVKHERDFQGIKLHSFATSTTLANTQVRSEVSESIKFRFNANMSTGSVNMIVYLPHRIRGPLTCCRSESARRHVRPPRRPL